MVSIYETPESPVLAKDSAERRYKIEGTDSELVARAMLMIAAPVAFSNGIQTLVRQDARVEPDDGDMWSGVVPYGERTRPETGESTYQFDTGGGTHHITQALATIGTYVPPGDVAPDYKGAIGVTLDNVEGVDIHIPIYHFSETHYLPVAAITGAYKALLFALTGTVNDAGFRGFAKGEVLFCGASGSQRGEEDWQITFKWAASPNKTDIAVGLITVPAKEGWHYLWIRYRDKPDDAAVDMIKDPVAATVVRVYEYGDFADLGIGG